MDVVHRPINAAETAKVNRLFAQGLARAKIAGPLIDTVETQTHVVRGWHRQFLRREPDAPTVRRLVDASRDGKRDELLIAQCRIASVFRPSLTAR